MIIALSIVERIGNGNGRWKGEGGDSGGSGFADREMNCRCCASMFRVLFVKWRSQALGSAFPESELRILSLEDNGFKR